MLINNHTYQRETLSERPIRQPLRTETVTVQIMLYERILTDFAGFGIKHGVGKEPRLGQC